MPKQKITEKIAAFSVCLFISYLNMTFYADLSRNAGSGLGGWMIYRDMSANLESNPGYPFNLRKLSPLIAHCLSALGFSLNGAWLFLTIISMAGAYYWVYRILREHAEVSHGIALFWTALGSFTYWFSGFNFRIYWLPDPLNYFFFAICLYYALSQEWKIFYPLLILGLLNKEVCLLLFPLPIISSIFPYKSTMNKQNLIKHFSILIFIAVLFFSYRAWWANLYNYKSFFYVPGSNGNASSIDNAAFNLMHYKQFSHIFGVFDFLWIYFLFGLVTADDSLLAKNHHMKHFTIYALAALFASRPFSDTPRVFVLFLPYILYYSTLLVKSWQATLTHQKSQQVFDIIVICFFYCLIMGGSSAGGELVSWGTGGTQGLGSKYIISICAVTFMLFRQRGLSNR